jgi:hypothetical protein
VAVLHQHHPGRRCPEPRRLAGSERRCARTRISESWRDLSFRRSPLPADGEVAAPQLSGPPPAP